MGPLVISALAAIAVANAANAPSCVCLQALHLEELQERPWQIAPTNGLTGEGLDKAMEWLADKLLRS